MLTWQWCGFFWTYLLSRLENYFKSKYSVNRQSLSLLFSVIPRTDHSQERNCIKIMPVKATTQESRAILNAEVKHGCSQLPSPWADRQGKSHVPVAHAQCPAQYSSGHQGPAHSSVRKCPPPDRKVGTGKVTELFNIHTSRTNTELVPQLFNVQVVSAPVHLLKWESLPVPANTCLGPRHDDNQTPVLSGNNKSCHPQHLRSFKQEIQNFDWHSSKC